jgi:hypothetical protein
LSDKKLNNSYGGRASDMCREKETSFTKKHIHTYDFSSQLGLLNLGVPNSLGVYHMHESMIPSHDT